MIHYSRLLKYYSAQVLKNDNANLMLHYPQIPINPPKNPQNTQQYSQNTHQ